jgi:hypothetical protein
MYINAVANSVMLHSYLQLDFYDTSFKPKRKLYIASESAHHHPTPHPGEKFWVRAYRRPSNRRLGRPQSSSGRFWNTENHFSLLGFELRTVQPHKPCHYTDYATPEPPPPPRRQHTQLNSDSCNLLFTEINANKICPCLYKQQHPLQIWLRPLGICKISKTNMLTSPLKDVQHPTASTSCLCLDTTKIRSRT